MQFVATLQPCPACGARYLGELDFRREHGASGPRWTASWSCGTCETVSFFTFTAKGDPTFARRGRFNLGPGASALLSPEQLLGALDETLPRLPAPDAITRALTCVVELLKLVPSEAPLPGATDDRLARKPLEGEYMRLKRLLVQHAPPNSITEAMSKAHDEWIGRGAKGGGRLVLEGRPLVGERYDSVDWSLSRIADCDLTNGSLLDVSLQLAELERVVFTGATVSRTSLSEAHITGGTWTYADLSSLRLGGAVIRGTDFTGSDMDRADFVHARVFDAHFDGVRFGTSVFDRAVFRNCTFRGASFAKFMDKPEPTSAGAQLVDCDLTDTEWTGRDLSQTTFVRCKLAGAHGKPKATNGIVLEDCDLDTIAFVRQLVGVPPPPPPPKVERPLVDNVRVLVDGEPPRTVGALFDALGITLDASLLEGGATGTLVVPARALDISRPRLTVRYAFDPKSGAIVATADALRDRKLLAFSIVCIPKEAIDAALRARFGAPTTIAGVKGDDLRVFGRAAAPGWVQTARSAVVGWYAALPDWLATPPAPEPRHAALRAILEGVRGAASLDDVRAVAARLPAAGGVAARATQAHAPDHVELVFAPPIAAKHLENALVMQSVVAMREADGSWILRRLANANESGKTAPLALGTWPLHPRLADAPAGGRFDDATLHSVGPLDVVAALRIGAEAPKSRWSTLMAALVEAPPRTVGELSTALGVALDGVDLGATTDRLALPALTGRFDAEGGAPSTIDALRARRIIEWKATLDAGFVDAENVLVARFGKPIPMFGDRRYGPWALRSADDGTPDAGAVLHRERAITTGTPLTAVAARPDGARIAVGDDVGRLRIWSPAEARETAFHTGGAGVLANVWTHDGEKLVVIHDRSSTVFLFSGDGTKHVGSFRTGHGKLAAVAVHPSRNVVATTGTDGVVRVWDLASDKAMLELDAGEAEGGTAIAMSATHVAAGFRSGRFRAWKLETGERIASGAIFDAYVSAMAFSPDGTSLVCGGGAGGLVEILTADWSSGARWKGTPPKPIATNAIVFDRAQPNGRFLCAHSDDTASLFASRVATSPEQLGKSFHLDRKPWEQAFIVSGACFVPGTRILVTSHFTGRLRIWQDGDVMTWNIGEVTFDHDGPKLVGGGVADAKEWWSIKSPRGAATAAAAPAPAAAAPAADIVRFGGPEHRARNTAEMEFAASLHPCATCGGPIGKTEIHGSENAYTLVGACPYCSRVRSFTFATEGSPVGGRARARRELGDARPSRVILPAQLLAELARVAPAIDSEPSKLTPEAWRANASALDRALTCVNELLKFIPEDGAAIPEAELTRERARLLDIDARALADVGRIWELRQGKLTGGDEIRAVLYQAYPRLPTAIDLRAYFETRRMRRIEERAGDVVVELGDSAGIVSARVWDDARGAHAELVMRDCTPESLAEVVKPHGTPPELVVNERRVLIAPSEVDGDRVRRVTVSFPRVAPGAVVVEPPTISPGAAFILAYLPARRLAYRAQLDRLERHAPGADPRLAKVIDDLRHGSKDEESKLAGVDEWLAQIAKQAGVDLPAPPPSSIAAGAWVGSLAAAVRPRLTTPVLETAWRAGETARRVAIAVRAAAQLARLRHAAPEHAKLRAEAVATAGGLTESAAALTTDLQATGLALVREGADGIQRMVGSTSDLQPTTVGGYEELDRLVGDLDRFFESKARQLDAP